MNRPLSRRSFVRQYLTEDRRPFEVRFREHIAAQNAHTCQPGTTQTSQDISFKAALAIAAQCKETLDGIERLRGAKVPRTNVTIQVDRDPGNRKKRVFRLFGPATEVVRLLQAPTTCSTAWRPVRIEAA